MKNNFKKIFILCLVASLMVGCTFKKKDTNEEDNNLNKVEITEKNVVKDQVISGIKISDIKMEVVDGITTFNAVATNVSKENIDVEIIRIIVKDKDDKEIAKLTGYIGDTLKPNESKKIVNTTDIDLSSAKSISFEKE